MGSVSAKGHVNESMNGNGDRNEREFISESELERACEGERTRE